MAIAYEKFIHPEDRAAFKKLKAVPGWSTAVGLYEKLFAADALRAVNLASKIKVGPRQFPKLHAILNDVCDTLKIDVPEFYIEENPERASYVCGVSVPIIAVDAETIDYLSEKELKVILAHECGHILCQHIRYNTLAEGVLEMKSRVPSVAGATVVAGAMKLGFAYWLRKSEFSADRVAAFVMKDADIVARTMMRLAFGRAAITKNVNMDEFLEQAKEYASIMKDAGVASTFKENLMVKYSTTPYPAVRAAEVIEWFRQSDVSANQPSQTTGRDGKSGERVSGAKTSLGQVGALIKSNVRMPKKLAKFIPGHFDVTDA